MFGKYVIILTKWYSQLVNCRHYKDWVCWSFLCDTRPVSCSPWCSPRLCRCGHCDCCCSNCCTRCSPRPRRHCMTSHGRWHNCPDCPWRPGTPPLTWSRDWRGRLLTSSRDCRPEVARGRDSDRCGSPPWRHVSRARDLAREVRYRPRLEADGSVDLSPVLI